MSVNQSATNSIKDSIKVLQIDYAMAYQYELQLQNETMRAL